MVTIKVENLIDFVADDFGHAESSPEEARRIATYLATAGQTVTPVAVISGRSRAKDARRTHPDRRALA